MSKIKAKQNLAQNTEQANPQQLLQFLDNIVAMAPVNRQVHVQAQQAIQRLNGALGELDKLQKEKHEWQKPPKSE